MAEDKNPEDKPSFFDSGEEASSWPPSDAYEVEESGNDAGDSDAPDDSENNFFNGGEPDALDELLAEDNKEEPEPEEVKLEPVEAEPVAEEPEPAAAKEEDEVDMLFSGNAFDSEDTSPSKPEPVEEEEDDDDEEILLKPVDPVEELVIDPEPDPPKPEPEPEPVAAEPEPAKESEPVPIVAETEMLAVADDFDIDDLISDEPSVEELPEEEELVLAEEENTASEPEPSYIEPEPSFAEEASEEEDSEALPFRTYSKLDYTDEAPAEEFETEEAKPNILANRNIVILLAVFLLFGGFFIYNTVFNRKIDTASRRKRRPPKKSKKVLVAGQKELMPVWEVSAQKGKSYNEELRLVKALYKDAGRSNPFAMPKSVIDDLRKQAALAALKKQKPNTYRRKAYRATLVGVLTSKDSTIALVNQQEASFDIVEGTGKSKILKLATKAMDKAKKNTQEMIEGSYIGPWSITKIDSPDNAFSEAKVHIEYEGLAKILDMGKAVELGIFTEGGEIDNLEEPVEEVSLEDFDL